MAQSSSSCRNRWLGASFLVFLTCVVAVFNSTLSHLIPVHSTLANPVTEALLRGTKREKGVGGHDTNANGLSKQGQPDEAPSDDRGGTPTTNGRDTDDGRHKVAGLSCAKYGGPSDEIAAEMVYWSDIPSDSQFVSPFRDVGPERKYLTFEPDEGGWNNIRMSMETAVVLAHAMGRILVLPPEQKMYLLNKGAQGQKNSFSFADFFHFESVALEHAGVEVITTKEFLEREVLTGNIRDVHTGERLYPPDNRTDWDGIGAHHTAQSRKLGGFLKRLGVVPQWAFDKCVAVFPDIRAGSGETDHFARMAEDIVKEPVWKRIKSFHRNATSVKGHVFARLREDMAHRGGICLYNETLQNEPVVHFLGENNSGLRLLVHFYAFLFFEDWTVDLWTKRFVRDHLRYVDEIQCAAARVVNAVREMATRNGDPDGNFDTFHIRRGDFQYKETRIEADEIYDNVKDVLVENSTVYVATDERNTTFFDPLRKHYKLCFLDDFLEEVGDTNTNFYGMLDQRVASRGRTFVGTYYSTFTGYIHRMRGYHSQKDRAPGHQRGEMRSYYYVPLDKKHDVSEYAALSPPLWAREFPVGWRDLDRGIEELHKRGKER